MADLKAVLFWQQNREETLSSSLSVEQTHQHDPRYGLCSHPAAEGLREKPAMSGRTHVGCCSPRVLFPTEQAKEDGLQVVIFIWCNLGRSMEFLTDEVWAIQLTSHSMQDLRKRLVDLEAKPVTDLQWEVAW